MATGLSKEKDLSIILPAFNEEENIEPVILDIVTHLKEKKITWEIIVVDDGSADATYKKIANLKNTINNLILLRHKKNQGYGSALRSGFACANGKLIFFTDSDRQFNFKEIDNFLEKIKEADFVIGFRKRRKDSLRRVVSGAVFNLVCRLFFGVKVKDIDCAFKIFRREVLKPETLISDGILINLEILVRLKRKKYKFLELPVSHYPRSKGRETGGNFRVVLKALASFFPLWFLLVVREKLRPPA